MQTTNSCAKAIVAHDKDGVLVGRWESVAAAAESWNPAHQYLKVYQWSTENDGRIYMGPRCLIIGTREFLHPYRYDVGLYGGHLQPAYA